MIKDLEFRAWDKKSKKYRVISSIVYDTTSRHSIDPKIKLIQLWGQPFMDDGECNPDVLCMRKPNEVELEQYTGLKDKNDKKIFDGDYVKHNQGTDLVHFDDGCWCLGSWCPGLLYDNDSYRLEVVGNKHENDKGESKNARNRIKLRIDK
jgi:hypothetical protein